MGTDGTSRHNESLLAKARGLTHEGITAYMLTGSYEIPLHNMTGDVRRDIILINECLGIGEVALSDHRSSQPTREELEKVLTQARLGGMLSGKAGVVQFHMGVGKRGMDVLLAIVRETEIPASNFIPTHVNRAIQHFLFFFFFAFICGSMTASQPASSPVTPSNFYTKRAFRLTESP